MIILRAVRFLSLLVLPSRTAQGFPRSREGEGAISRQRARSLLSISRQKCSENSFGRNCIQPTRLFTTANSRGDCDRSSGSSSSTGSSRLQCGLLFSSFSDGLKVNVAARDYLRRGLIRAILQQDQARLVHQAPELVIQSPCCGPDTFKLDQLESLDQALDKVWTTHTPLELFHRTKQGQGAVPELRCVYIPTAMYALRRNSKNTPGKQHQRARADGKKRRDALCAWLKDHVFHDHVDIAAVTIDFFDGSVKQPYGSIRDHGGSVFPTSAIQALTVWNPHLVYVEGGNTFWLHYCCFQSKHGYNELLTELLTETSTVYCGSSAGAILAGKRVETACWKGWDDPAVVPYMELPQDWKGVAGLDLCEGQSFFPHMTSDWDNLVDKKRNELNGDDSSAIVCLEEDTVYCVGQHLDKPILYSTSDDPHIF